LLVSLPARSFYSSVARSSSGGGTVSGSSTSEEDQRLQSELVFLGTGTSEGIPRVSCLTHPTKTCPVCHLPHSPSLYIAQQHCIVYAAFLLLIVACFVLSCMQVCTKAAEPGNPNRRRNTSILLRHVTASGTTNIVVDAGKYVLSMSPTTCFASFFL